jgi:hypothetical protein
MEENAQRMSTSRLVEDLPVLDRRQAAAHGIETVEITTAIGATRRFFLCPACGRRCVWLYRPDPAQPDRCRQCCGLRYRSQTLPKHARYIDRANRIRVALGGQPGYALPPKPTRMRQDTYLARLNQIAKLERSAYDTLRAARH